VGSNPNQGMDICVCVYSVFIGLGEPTKRKVKINYSVVSYQLKPNFKTTAFKNVNFKLPRKTKSEDGINRAHVRGEVNVLCTPYLVRGPSFFVCDNSRILERISDLMYGDFY
jgi:hypothetical protein